MTIKSFDQFPRLDQDDCYDIRDLGQITCAGITMSVEMEAFSETEEGMVENDYDASSADIHLKSIDGTDLSEFYDSTDLRLLLLRELQEFLENTITGETDVTWGESGAQSEDSLSFGRNGW